MFQDEELLFSRELQKDNDPDVDLFASTSKKSVSVDCDFWYNIVCEFELEHLGVNVPIPISCKLAKPANFAIIGQISVYRSVLTLL